LCFINCIKIILGRNTKFGLNYCLSTNFPIKYGYQTRLSLQTEY
jgi:hypothetical protein